MANGDVSGPEAFLIAIGEVLSPDAAKQMAEAFGLEVPPTVAEKLGAGAGTVQSKAKEGLTQPIEDILGEGVTVSQAKGGEIVTAVGNQLSAGANTITNEAKTGLRDPVVQETSLIPNEAGTGLQPIEGVFSTEFQKANIAAVGIISLLLADIDKSMGFLVQNTAEKLNLVTDEWIKLSTNIGTSTGEINTSIAEVQKTESELSKNTATYTKSMSGNISGFKDSATQDFGEVSDVMFETQGTASDLSKNIKTYMSSMSTNVNTATGNMISDFDDLVSTLEDVTSAAKDVKKAIEAIPDHKTITIDYKINKPKGVQHGGAWVTGMQQGGSFIADKPMRFDGVNMGEHYKPELVTVTPLTNPNDLNDKTVDFDLGNSAFSKSIPRAVEDVKHIAQTQGTNTTGGMGLPQNIEVTVVMPNGEVLARVVKPLLLRNYSAIV